MSGELWTRVVKLSPDLRIDGFFSGEPSIDMWFQRDGLDEQEQGGCTVYVAVDDSYTVIGFFSLSMHKLQKRIVPGSVRDDLTISGNIPCVLLGRLGIDQHFRGKTFRQSGGKSQGSLLVKQAIKQAQGLAEIVGCRLMFVQALNDELIDFYSRQGFVSLPSNPRNMVLDLRKHPS